jgi:transposase InsO family protein
VSANQVDANALSVRVMCRVLGVSHSGYYDWQHRAPSARAMANVVLTEQIRSVHRASDETYGMPRVHAQLRHDGHRISRKRVARLMRDARLRGVSRRRGFTVTTRRDHRARPAPDLVNRCFRAEAANQLWVADMTYIPTWAGFRSWKSKAEAKMAVFTWIESWYNPRRLHSALAYLSPINFEEQQRANNDRATSTGLPTASAGSSQAPTAAVDNPASQTA